MSIVKRIVEWILILVIVIGVFIFGMLFGMNELMKTIDSIMLERIETEIIEVKGGNYEVRS